MTDEPNTVAEPISTLAVFDICDTLYAQNTTFGFVRFVNQRRPGFALLDTMVTARWSPAFVGLAASGKVTGRDLHRALYLRTLAGKTRAELDAAAEGYVAQILAPLAVTSTHAALSDALGRGQTVCLASSTLDCVAGAIARRFGTRWLSSMLDYRDGVCTGRLASDLTGRKAEAILSLPGLRAGATHIRVFTDNATDRELVKLADEATVILPRGRGREKWTGCDVDFVEV